MIFAAIATQVLARTTRLLNGRKSVQMTGKKYMRRVVPIGLVFSASLVCSNMPYLYLSVAFIQMLKVSAPPPAPPVPNRGSYQRQTTCRANKRPQSHSHQAPSSP